MRAMSLVAGCFCQPDALMWARTSIGAPQRGQAVAVGSDSWRQ
jgi:hypothetical protein